MLMQQQQMRMQQTMVKTLLMQKLLTKGQTLSDKCV
jgi:hypothetical protein